MRGLAVALALLVGACGGTTEPTAPKLDVILDDEPAPTLAAYGLFTDDRARVPAKGVVPYDLINPLFSDHSIKHRLVFIPSGKKANDVGEVEVLNFPVGTVLVKTFAFAPDLRNPQQAERYIETRLLIHKADGWDANTYIWNAEQNAAIYSPVGGKAAIETINEAGEALAFTYSIPNKNQCKTCHQTGDALAPIGPKVRNLNHIGPANVNQIDDWIERGILVGKPAMPRAVPNIHDTNIAVASRARAYLDINCAHCHKANGSASNSGLWLTLEETAQARLGIAKFPTAAGRGAGTALHVISPGQPDASILVYRMESTEPGIAMPELGRSLTDKVGTQLVRQWIAEMGQE